MAGTCILSPRPGCLQVRPGSTWQADEQPSPLTLLPSSHSSDTTRPSPHGDEHTPVPQPGSFWQSAEHPSKGIVLPSSQLSAPSFFLSPHIVCVHLLGAPSHFQPTSS